MNDSHRSGNRFWVLLMTIGCVVVLLLDFVIDRHADADFEGWTGFYPLFGFVAIVLLILLSKILRRIVSRQEDFYGD